MLKVKRIGLSILAAALFDEQSVEHGEVRDLPDFGIMILSFSDPDGIQLELTAPLE